MLRSFLPYYLATLLAALFIIKGEVPPVKFVVDGTRIELTVGYVERTVEFSAMESLPDMDGAGR